MGQQPIDDSPDITEEQWNDETGGDESPESFAEPTAADDADSQPAATAPAPQEPATAPDPYAGLPEPVRNALTAIPQMEQRMRSAEGRVAALQRELAQRAQAPAPAAEAPPRTKLDALRDELPEVVEAIEEARGKAVDADALRKQLREEITAQLQEDLIEERHADWAQTVTGPEFQNWLARQPADYQAKVRGTDRASVLSAALDGFTKAKAAAPQAPSNRRIAAAVTPTGGRRAPSRSEDDMTDDELWDEITKDS